MKNDGPIFCVKDDANIFYFKKIYESTYLSTMWEEFI